MSNIKHLKFKTLSFNGSIKSYWTVDKESLNLSAAPKKDRKPGHSIMIVDRSGSMWNDINPLKDMLIKLLTLDEYNNSDMLVSLVSYSTAGDCQVHFERKSVKDVMKSDSPQQKEIKKINAGGLTCISQAINVAKGLIKADEATAITLHSDGYANDPGVWAEQKQIMAVCEGIKGQNVFINTVAYSPSSDFTFLSSVANAASGKCVRADNVKQVYDAMYEASAAVNGETTPPIELPIGASQYQVFVSKSKARVNGSADGLSVAGMTKDDDATVYRYREVSESEFVKSTATEDQDDAILALAKAKLSEGKINEAKVAMYSAGFDSLTEKHMRALTSPQLSSMATDIDKILLCDGDEPRSKVIKPLAGNTTVLDLIKVLEDNRDGILLNLEQLAKNYKSRGVKRVPGVRGDDGKVEKPWLDVEHTDDGGWVQMGTFDVNRNTATVNIMIVRPSRLVKTADRSPISQIAGVNVASLPTFRNFTVIGDGEITVPVMKLKFGKKSAFDAVNKLIPLNGSYDCNAEYDIALSSLPVSPYEFTGDLNDLHSAYRQILSDKVMISILSAVTKEASVDYTAEQVEELKKHYLSKSLNINLPTVTEYDDLEQALKDGRVDTRVSYKVEIGDTALLNAGRLKSANEFLDRHFAVVDSKSGQISKDKPKMEMFLDSKYTFEAKALSAKVKITEADKFCKPIFEDFLGLASNGLVKEIMARAGVKKSVMDLVRGGSVAMIEAMKVVEAHQESIYRDKISPVVFFIGATGMVPESLGAKAETADAMESKVDGLKLSKAEKEGTFFQAGDVVVSVYAKNEYFSTGKK